jgi:acetylornithine deacetylase/succinyl-diaminopimelate desuccinylase-like protein
MLAVARMPPDPAAAVRLSAQSAYFNALLRTTCVATRLEGGHAVNALPQLAAANVNCRIFPGTSPAEVMATLTKVLGDPAITISLVGEARPSKPAVLRDDLMSAVETISASMFPGVPVVPVMSTGATDSLFLRNAGIPTFGADGLFDDIDDVRAHGRDERVGIRQFNEDLEFQYRLITALSK